MSTEASHTDPLDVFRKPPLAGLILFAVVGIAGVIWAVLRTGREVVATCGGDPMAQGDTCSTRARRSMTRTEWTYDERLEFATAQHNGLVAGGIAVTVCAAIVIVFLLVRWLRDRAVAASLAGQAAPLTSYADRSGVGTGALSLIACVPAFFGASLLVQGLHFTVRNQIGSVVAGIVILLVALAILVAAFPRGSTLVWAQDESVRVVTRSRIRDLAWQDMQYLVSFSNPPLRQLTWTGKAPKLTIEDDEFFTLVRNRINEVLAAVLPARQAAGETLDFGDVTVSGSTVKVEKTVLDRAQIASIGRVRNQNGEYLVFADQAGKSLASISEMNVVNRDLLVGVVTGGTGGGTP